MKLKNVKEGALIGKCFLGGLIFGTCCEIMSSKKTSYSLYFASRMGIVGSALYLTKKIFKNKNKINIKQFNSSDKR